MKHITFSCCYATEFEQHAQPVKLLDYYTKFWSIRTILFWRTGWWFQPSWKILVKLCQVKNLPQTRLKLFESTTLEKKKDVPAEKYK